MYYSKYKRIYETHMSYIKTATTTKKLVSPLGREYTFEPKEKRGELIWSESDIVNWPNQGLGADVMVVARIAARQRWKRAGLTGKLISTVHDSIVADVPEHEVPIAASLFDGVFRELPELVSQTYGIDWNVPMVGEVSVGPNMLDLTEIKL
jgi:DNA polymerase I-like protein with 3'-5' exonuclease and polymerase domains